MSVILLPWTDTMVFGIKKEAFFFIDFFFSRLFYVFTEEKLLILHSVTMRGKLFEPFLSVSDVILVSLVHC